MQSIGEQILGWSGTRPAWQRDALRRLFLHGTLTPEDTEELGSICRAEHAALNDGESAAPAEPLSAEHLSQGHSGGPAICLMSIRNVERVNALAPGKSLNFAEKGLTVIYGDNGAGKTGYTRILKRVCRARGERDAILPDIFAETTPEGPTAVIEFGVDGDKRTHVWSSTTQNPKELAQISVFDSHTATVYVEEKTDVAFRPFGLDVFPKLVSACDTIRGTLTSELMALGGERPFPELLGETPVGNAVRNLLAKDAEPIIESLSVLSSAEQTRLEELKRLVFEMDASAPAKRANELRLKATRLRRLLTSMRSAVQRLDVRSLQNLYELRGQFVAAREAAQFAREKQFSTDSRWAIGGNAWKLLWEAARAYSTTVVYPGAAFPVTEDNSQCVLCHQVLDATARGRLTGFEDFIKAEIQTREAEASDAFDRAVREVQDSSNQLPPQETLPSEIGAEGDTLTESIQSFISAASDLQRRVDESLESDSATTETALDTSAVDLLERHCDGIDREARDLEEAQLPDGARKIRQEYAALAARKLLRNLKGELFAERRRRQRAAALRSCLKQTDTAGITTKNTELTKAGISEELRKRFQSELNSLRLTHLTVSVEPQFGAKGVTYHRVQFANAAGGSWGMKEVLSEGEHRCVALAGFLAELSTQESPSGIVFDDPVSSLDHLRREVVAQRMVSESLHKQVIVFSHDIVFVLLLHEECGKQEASFTAAHLSKEGDRLGVPVEGLPWYGLPIRKRVGWLRDAAVKLTKLQKTALQSDYEREASFLWGRLREAWEAGVEDVLLNGVVKRFSRKISTQQLPQVSGITEEDIKKVERAMTECSKWLPGHDISGELNTPIPSADVFASAVEELEAWRAAIEKRRQS
jgi:hypothetical protein